MVVYNNDNPEIWVRVHAQIGRYWLYQIGALAWIPLLANKCPGLWPNRKLLKHFKCLGGLPAVSPLSTSMPYSSFSSSFPSLLFICGQQREREGERGVTGEGVPKPPRLTIFQAPKFSYGLCPSSYAHTMRKRESEKRRRKNEKKTLRAEREWEWEIQAKLLRVRVPVEPCQTNQHHTIPTTPTKQTENELTLRYLGYSIRLGNKRFFNISSYTKYFRKNMEFL